jgi:hypothetical protein
MLNYFVDGLLIDTVVCTMFGLVVFYFYMNSKKDKEVSK